MKYIGRIVSIPIGLVLIAVGIIIVTVVHNVLNDEFEKAAVVIPDNGADEIVDPWIRFIGNENDPNNERIYKFYAFNCTNPTEVLQGALPKYQQVGPYNYKYIYERINYNLTDDQEELSFQLWKRYYPLTTKEVPDTRDPNADVIYHFNLAYAGALAQAGGSELTLSYAMAAAFVQKVTTLLGSQAFLQLALPMMTPLVLGGAFQTAVQTAIAGGAPDANTAANLVCQDMVSNPASTNPIAFSFGGQLTVPSTLNVTKCRALYSTDNAKSILDSTAYAGYATKALDTVLAATPFSLDATEIAFIYAYWNLSKTYAVPKIVLSQIPECKTVTCVNTDIGLYQWGLAGGILGGLSVADVKIPGQTIPTKPEFGITTKVSLSQAQIKMLINESETYNVVSVQGMVTIQKTLLAAGAVPGFTTEQALALNSYIGFMMGNFSDVVLKSSVFANFAGGPITKHTVHQMLFNATDPLLAILLADQDPSHWLSSPLENIQTKEEATAELHRDTIYTGVGDISKVSSPKTFEGEPTLNYKVKIPVSGSFAEQLPPNYLFDDIEADVNIFTEEYARSLSFYKEFGGDFEGIPYYRYRIKPENWAVNDTYYQTIPYLMNLNSIKGAPAYLSRPRMKGLAPGYFYKAGLEDLINDEEDLDVFADYEPRSGKAIHGRYSLQVNGYTVGTDGQNSTAYNKYTTMRADVVHPMFLGVNVIAATEDQVDILTKAYKVDSVRYALTTILIVIGGFLCLVAGGLFVLDIFENKGYF